MPATEKIELEKHIPYLMHNNIGHSNIEKLVYKSDPNKIRQKQ